MKSTLIKTIGVLALQGDFAEHIRCISKLGMKYKEIRKTKELEYIDGLIIPGGETTTLMKLMKIYGFDSALKNFKKPIWGTCAGCIVLSKDYLNKIDIEVKRNAYGRQLDSFEEMIDIDGIGNREKAGKGKRDKSKSGKFNCVFIRAPVIEEVGSKVKILGMFNGKAIIAKENNVLVSTFHPELEKDLRVHRMFVDMC